MEVRELDEDDAEAFAAFIAEVPESDRTFFKEDLENPQRMAAAWVADERPVRVLGSGFAEALGVRRRRTPGES